MCLEDSKNTTSHLLQKWKKHQNADSLSEALLKTVRYRWEIGALSTLFNLGKNNCKDSEIFNTTIQSRVKSRKSNRSDLSGTRDGALVQKKFRSFGEDIWFRAVIPKHLRLDIVRHFTMQSTAGHLGFIKTYDRTTKEILLAWSISAYELCDAL
ncbi:hypothetical protein AVEN_253997-1 [Araneus ventricosus]|uniref:Uncharacterized protein n=1 Tax=Araneus ventricosus TaxID=182803 RepID=A0A4Y2E9P0_ARAVE|nr:hypothetical protein AVEN_253997-1 [Araneus ventricosus]